MTLRDGRRLTYAEWGPPESYAVLGFHGTPNSRHVHLGSDAPRAAGVRLILPDRPGFGGSDFYPARRLLDWPSDVAQLVDVLGIEQFGVFGISGGGPHAAACAFALPDRVNAAALVASVGPVRDAASGPAWTADSAIAWSLELLELAQRSPQDAKSWAAELCERELAAIAQDPESWLDMWAVTAPAADRELIGDAAIRSRYIASGLEAVRRGPTPYAQELLLLWTEPWGFRLEEILQPVHIWHGDDDRSVPVAVAHHLARSLPNSALHVCHGEGHMLVHRHATEILLALSR